VFIQNLTRFPSIKKKKKRLLWLTQLYDTKSGFDLDFRVDFVHFRKMKLGYVFPQTLRVFIQLRTDHAHERARVLAVYVFLVRS
jgi:hypothetical protein